MARIICFLTLTIALDMLACAPRATRPAEKPQQTASNETRLVNQLPADTTFYGQIDIAGLLTQYRANSAFIDPEITQRMAVQAQHMLDALIQIASEKGFKPLLAKTIHQTKLHFVGLTRPSTSAANQPNSDAKGEINFSFLIECNPKLAKNFIDQLKAFMQREFESQAGNAGLWTTLDTDSGEMIRFNEMKELVVGWFDKYIVVSNEIPRRLFTAIRSTEDPSNFAENERFARYCQSGSPFYFVANMQELVKDFEESMQRTDPEQAKLLADLLGLRELRSAGFMLDLNQTDETSTYRATLSLQHGQMLTPLQHQVLRGGREFRLPRGTQDADLAVMWRLGLSEIYKLVIQQLPPNVQQQQQMASAMVSSATGYSLAALLELLSGDFYWFNKMNQRTEAKIKTAKSSKEALEIMFSGWNAVFVGIRDQAATKQALQKIFEALSSMSMTAQMMSTRTFQGQQIYLVGQGKDIENDHIGVVIDHNMLVISDWNSLTDWIRKVQTDQEHSRNMQKILDKLPQANLLTVFSNKLLEKLEYYLNHFSDDPPLPTLIEQLRTAINGQGESWDKLQKAAVKLTEYSKKLDDKMSLRMAEPSVLIYAQDNSENYDLIIESNILSN